MKILTVILTIFSLNIYCNQLPVTDSENHWVINTSNVGKSSEYKDLLGKQGIGLSILEFDQDEIDADPLSVVVHKASQMGERILVEDTSLDVEGANIGVNLRWLVNDVKNYAGKKALWRVLLAYREAEHVYVYSGEIKGTIVQPIEEDDSNLEALFLPDASNVTLDLHKPDFLNPRALAVEAFMRDEPVAILPLIETWDGPWQNQE